MIAFNNTVNEDSDTNTKGLDPYENASLNHFLVNGKHANGISKSAVKRIEQAQKLISYDSTKQRFLFRKNNLNLKIPAPEERLALINMYHNLGHFKSESVIRRLQELYYWPQMAKQAEQIISRCAICHKFDHAPQVDHPAHVTRVTKIFEKIGIDLVLGFPPSIEGEYIGMLVITEYLSKFPVVFPIRNKSMAEIGSKLIEYIAMFGPPTEIVSDRGKEFVNEVVGAINKVFNVVHKQTSAYNPRTNGLTERFNQTLTLSLQKLSHHDKDNWPAYVPFVLFAYRARRHSTTNFSPFELMFGRRMNALENANIDHDEDYLSIIDRAFELKELVETTHPLALEQTSRAQHAQVATQNRQKHASDVMIPLGTTVYVRKPSIKKYNKLDPTNKGPFVVTGQTSYGNYQLKDADGQAIPDSVPRWKLIVKPSPAGTTQPAVSSASSAPQSEPAGKTIQKILKKKNIGRGCQYLVKYKGLNSDYNEWLKGSAVPKGLAEAFEQSRTKGATRTATAKSLLPIHILTLLYLLFFPMAVCVAIKGNYTFCDVNSAHRMLDLENFCQEPVVFTNETSTLDIAVLTYEKHVLRTHGFQCFMKAIDHLFRVDWFGNKYHSSAETNQIMTRLTCLDMIESRKCKDKNMICDSDSCESSDSTVPEYSFWNTIKLTGYECKFVKRLIVANKMTDKVFPMSESDCLPMNGFCKLASSITVWNTSHVTSCPFRLYKIYKNAYSFNSMIIVKNDSFFVKVTKSHFHSDCRIDHFSTTEGLHVYILNNQKKSANAISDQKFLDNLLPGDEAQNLARYAEISLAHEDMSTYLQWLSLSTGLGTLSKRLCSMVQRQLEIIQRLDDSFVTISLDRNQSFVVYSKNGALILPDCHRIQEFTIIEAPSDCFKHLAITFTYKSKLLPAFYHSKNFLIQHSHLVDCRFTNLSVYLDKLFVSRINNSVSVKEHNLIPTSVPYHLYRLEMDNSFNHDLEIIDNLDIIDTMRDLANFKITDSSHLVIDAPTELNFAPHETIIDIKASIRSLNTLFMTALGIVFAILLVILGISLRSHLIACFKCLLKCATAPSKCCRRSNAKPAQGMSPTGDTTNIIELQPLAPPNITTTTVKNTQDVPALNV